MPLLNNNYSLDSKVITGAGRKKAKQIFFVFYVFIIAALFYSMGNFGFLNIFGLRRQVQFCLLASLLPLVILALGRFMKLLRKPLFPLLLILIFSDLIFQRSLMVLFDHLASILVLSFLFSFEKDYSNRILKYIIILSCAFSIMVIIQAIVLIFRPEIFSQLFVYYTSLTQDSDKLILEHPLALLGFCCIDPIYLFGEYIYRFRSFATEPSALVCTFLVPGILALTYKGYMRLCAIPILFFVVFLSQAGTAWLSICFGIIAWGLLWLFRRRVSFLSVLPFLIMILGFISLLKIDILSFVWNVMGRIEWVSDYYTGLSRYSSGAIRLQSIANGFSFFKDNIFGMPVFPDLAGVGFLITLALSGGIVSFVLGIIVFYHIFKLSVYSFKLNKGIIRFASALLYGTIIQLLWFSSYGWDRSPGFIMLALIINRLEILMAKATNNVKRTKVA